jgi:uncharacterized protein (TIGR03435 family)
MRVVVVAALSCITVLARAPQFEAASIRPAPADARGARCTGGPGTADPGLLTCQNYSLSWLVMMAYDLRGFQLSAPGWMSEVRFQLSARIPPGADRAAFHRMQQHLLAERFGLQAHFEKREIPVYELSVGRDGSKLKPSAEPPAEKPERLWSPPPGGPPRPLMAVVDWKNQSTLELATLLADLLGAPVLDRTGLGGRYDVHLRFLMEPGGRAAGPVADAAAAESGADLAGAVREQLGLRLVKTRAQREVLIVDRIERTPSEN